MLGFIPFGGILNAVMNNRLVQIAMAIGAAILFLKIRERKAYKQGAKDTKDYVERVSNEAAQVRREARDAVDLRTSRVGAAERLRDKWSRDG